MKRQRRPHWLLLGSLTLMLAVFSLSLIATTNTGSARDVTVSQDTAVQQALKYATEGVPAGKLEGLPTSVHGQVTTYFHAYQAVSGNATVGGSELARDRPVWWIVFGGNVTVHIPASVDGTVPATDLTYPQISVIIDGQTAELLSLTMHAPGDEVKTDALPVLTLPTPGAPLPPTTRPAPTAAPLP